MALPTISGLSLPQAVAKRSIAALVSSISYTPPLNEVKTGARSESSSKYLAASLALGSGLRPVIKSSSFMLLDIADVLKFREVSLLHFVGTRSSELC